MRSTLGLLGYQSALDPEFSKIGQAPYYAPSKGEIRVDQVCEAWLGLSLVTIRTRHRTPDPDRQCHLICPMHHSSQPEQSCTPGFGAN